MSLTAATNEQEIVYASVLCEDDRANDRYFCRQCGEVMRLVLPKKHIIKHFRHRVYAGCSPESLIHMEAKQCIYDLYKNDSQWASVEVESALYDGYGDGPIRIGDVVLEKQRTPDRDNRNWEEPPVVIEIQNSAIEVDEIKARFRDWNNDSGDRVMEEPHHMMWVLTGNVISKKRLPEWVRFLFSLYGGILPVYVPDPICGIVLYRLVGWRKLIPFFIPRENYSIKRKTICRNGWDDSYNIAIFGGHDDLIRLINNDY